MVKKKRTIKRVVGETKGSYNFIIALGILLILLFVAVAYIDFGKKLSFSPAETCKDGTLYGECSRIGKYCNNGLLVENCNKCGCLPKEKFSFEEAAPFSSSLSVPSEKPNGYILELKLEPFFRKASAGVSYKNSLREEHLFVKQQASAILGRTVGKDIALLGEFQDSFNGIVLDITKEQCDLLKSRITSIKECYPNLEVKVLLDKSTDVINVPVSREAFNLTGKGKVIAVIDTGIDATHESLDDLDDNPETNDPKVIAFKDFVNFRTNAYDDHGHGTHCSGIAAGTGGAEKKYVGVAPGANLVGVKVLNNWGSGSFSNVIAGIEWALQNKDRYNISIISMSLGASLNSDGTTPVEIAVTTASQRGINVVVAAGNSGRRGANSVGIPASAKDIIAVGAVDNDKNIASFSSRGPSKDGRIKPEVSASGVGIVAPEANSRNGYVSHSGTSMATPHVAGVVALLEEANPSLDSMQIRQLLMDSSLDKGEIGPDNDYGWGIVDTFGALLGMIPFEHELMVDSISTEKVYDTKTPVKISAVIKNLGLQNETNLRVKFLFDGEEQSNRIIERLNSGESVDVNFVYATSEEGEFEVSVKVDSVDGEEVVIDNIMSKNVRVKDYIGKVNAVVLDSWGTGYSQYANFDDVNERWADYGNYKLEIDYTSLNRKETTYEILEQSKADVLIISDAWDDGSYLGQSINWEFSDTEIDAIKRYVSEGHGLIITSGTFNPERVQNNMKLAPLVGIDENSEAVWADFFEDSRFSINYQRHELFNNLDTYSTTQYATALGLDLNEQDSGDLLAESASGDIKALITGHHYGEGNTIYFSYMVEFSNSEEDYQVLYNSIIWTKQKFEETERELKLSDLVLADSVGRGEETSIKAKLANLGQTNVSDVPVVLKVDGSEIEAKLISLESGQFAEVEFNFSLSEGGRHFVELSVEPLGEGRSYDNYLGKSIFVPNVYLNGQIGERTEDLDGDGKIDYLDIDVGLDVMENVDVHISGTLTSGFGAQLSFGDAGEYLESGQRNLTFRFNAIDLTRMGLSGPYKLKDFVLSENGEWEESAAELYETQPYSYEQFESYPDLSIMNVNMEDKAVVNQSFVFEIVVENIGTEASDGARVDLYRVLEGEENYEFLTSEEIGSLEVFEEKVINFTDISDNAGDKDYLFRINSSSDGNLENNERKAGIRVISNGSYLEGYFYWSKLILNKENNVNITVRNIGVQNAQNVTLDVYSSTIYSINDRVLLLHKDLSNIAPDSEVEESFVYIPREINSLRFVGNISSSDFVGEEFSFYPTISLEGVDVEVHYFSLNNYPLIVNKSASFDFDFRSIGTENAKNVVAVLYVENGGGLIEVGNKTFGDLNVDNYGHGEISWVPTEEGEVRVILRVYADNDAYLENNERTSSYEVNLNSPDLSGWFRDLMTVGLGVSNNISFRLYNRGAVDAENISVNLYVSEDDGQNYSLEDSVLLERLESYGDKEINLSYIPSRAGYVRFMVNFSADNEIEENTRDNSAIFWNAVKVVSGADLYLEYPWSDLMFENRNASISVRVFNYGNEEAQNVSVALYTKKTVTEACFHSDINRDGNVNLNDLAVVGANWGASCNWENNWCDGADLNSDGLVGLQDLALLGANWGFSDYVLEEVISLGNLGVKEFANNNLTFKGRAEGSYNVKIKVFADNEGDYSDNERLIGFLVNRNGPHYEGSLRTWELENVLVGREVEVPVDVTNRGTEKAKNVTVRLFLEFNNAYIWASNFNLGDLDVSQTKRALMPYVAREAGYTNLKAEIFSRDNPNLLAHSYGSLRAVQPALDVSGEFDISDSEIIEGENVTINVEVSNEGNLLAKNVSAKLYDNGVLINSRVIANISLGDSERYSFVWTPYSGEHNLTLVASVNGDVDLANNIYSEMIHVYDLRDFDFYTINGLGAHVERYLMLGGEMYFADKIPFTIAGVGEERRTVGIKSNHYTNNASVEVSSVFLNSALEDNMSIKSEVYFGVSDGLLNFGVVFANKPEWVYNNLSYSVIYSDGQIHDNVGVYSCGDWNFESSGCTSGWNYVSGFLYSGEEGVYAEGISENAEAIGLTLSSTSLGEALVSSIASGDNSQAAQQIFGQSSGGSSLGSSRASGGGSSSVGVYNYVGSGQSLKVNLQDSLINSVVMNVVDSQNGGMLSVRELDSSKGFASPENKVYSYFEVVHPGLEGSNVRNSEIEFKVSKDWMSENKIDQKAVVLLGHDNSWGEVPTSYLREDESYVYYNSEARGGLSLFAIAVGEEALEASKSHLIIYFALAGATLVLIILLIVFIVRRKRANIA